MNELPVLSKSCRFCGYYQAQENFCAVAPDYLGKAHECVEYELNQSLSPENQEKEIKALTRLIYDQLYQQDREQAVQEGIQQGRYEGEASLILRQLKRRFGELASDQEERIRQLAVQQLENLGEALLDFVSVGDLTLWLEQAQLANEERE